MRARVTFERRQRLPDGGGGASEIWVPVVTRWARVSTGPAREMVTADGTRLRAAVSVVLRTRQDIAHDWRFRWRGRVFDIEAVMPDLPRAGLMQVDGLEGAPS